MLLGVQTLTLNVTVEQLVELAKQAEYKNPIEWASCQ